MRKFTLYSIFGVLLLVLCLYLPKQLKTSAERALEQLDAPYAASSRVQQELPFMPFGSTSTGMRVYSSSATSQQYATNPAFSNVMPLGEVALTSQSTHHSFGSGMGLAVEGGTTYSSANMNRVNQSSDQLLPNLTITSMAAQQIQFRPFAANTPSQVTAERIDNATPAAIRGKQNAWNPPTPSDPDQSEEFPVGEPWVLLIFAALTTLYVARKQYVKKQSTLTKS